MKKLLLNILFIMLVFSAMPQGQDYINGTVTDLVGGYPIPNHAVTIMTDSTNGNFYYNVVYTDSVGFYFDDVPVLSDSTDVLFVQTFDCNNNLLQAVIYYNANSNTYTQDFQICISPAACEAAFTYFPDSTNTPPYTYNFVDQSTGDIASWYWNFGDGQYSSQQSPSHSFAQPGTYYVCLNITGADSSCYNFTCDTIVVGGGTVCVAQFTYSPEPQGSPDSFRFIDLSIGNIDSWLWSFGDGTGSEEQNPLHVYAGPGTYTACLTITGNDCNDTFCNDIVISDTVYHQLYGQVFTGNFPLQKCSVMLFAMNPNGSYTPFGDAFPLDSNGVYYFTLVPDGIYLILAVPFDSSNYIPTYFGDVINWQSATQVILGIPDNPYNINLVPAGEMTPGPGSVSGQIDNAGFRITVVDKIIMILMNESLVAIGFSGVSSSGAFTFPAMDYGTYYLRAELSGVTCDNMKIEITPEKPHVNVILTLSGNTILAVGDINPANESISVYPNPVTNQLSISLNLSGSTKIDIEIFTITGQLTYRTSESLNTGQNMLAIPFYDFPEGLYMLRVFSANGINFVRKVIKSE
jgi:PKD repeat protein